MPDILTRGRIEKGPTLCWDKLGRPYLKLTLALDWVDDLPLFMQQVPTDHAISWATVAEQPPLFESP